MITRFSSKELLSLLVLVFAILLLSATMLYAQSSVQGKNGKITIKIMKEADGKTTLIDTSFDFTDEESINKILKNLDPDENVAADFDKKSDKPKRVIIKSRLRSDHEKELDDLEQEIEQSLDEARKSLDEVTESIKDIHIET